MINDNQSQFGGSPEGGNAGLTDQAKQLASSAQDQATERVKSGFMSGKRRAADTLQDVARALRTSSEQLNENAPGGTGRYVEQVADQVQRFADFIENAEPGELVQRTESFARRQPAVILGGAFALGLIGARFLKSSRRDDADFQNRNWDSAAGRPEMYDRERSVAGFSEPSTDRFSGAGASGHGSAAGTSGTAGSPGATGGMGTSGTTDPLRQNTGGSGNDPLRFGSSTAGAALDDDRLGASGKTGASGTPGTSGTGRSTGGRAMGTSGTGATGGTDAEKLGGPSGTTPRGPDAERR